MKAKMMKPKAKTKLPVGLEMTIGEIGELMDAELGWPKGSIKFGHPGKRLNKRAKLKNLF